MERVGPEGQVNRRIAWARWIRVALGCVIVVSTVGAATVISPQAGAVTAPVPKWVTQKTVLPVATDLAAISCPSALECVAVGASGSNNEAILRATDGGATWSN